MMAYMLFLLNPSSCSPAPKGGAGFFCITGTTGTTTTHAAERGT